MNIVSIVVKEHYYLNNFGHFKIIYSIINIFNVFLVYVYLLKYRSKNYHRFSPSMEFKYI